MAEIGGFTDVTGTRPLPGVEVSIRPDDIDGTLDILVRFPYQERSPAELCHVRVPTSSGLVPISNFVSFSPSERVGTIRRIDEKRVVTVEANVAPGVLVNDQVNALTRALEAPDLPEGLSYSFAGEAEGHTEAMVFLVGAFISAIFLMFVILLPQFNAISQAFIAMSAIVFSVAGVLLGLEGEGRPLPDRSGESHLDAGESVAFRMMAQDRPSRWPNGAGILGCPRRSAA